MKKKEFIIKYSDLNYLKEDIFQAEYGNLILDIGYYGDGFIKLYVIKDYNWDKPLEIVSFLDITLIKPLIEIFKEKFISGFYDGNYIVNKGYDKEI